MLALFAADVTAVQIEARTGASFRAVRNRISNLRQKLGARTTPQTIDIACRTGLLVPPRGVLRAPISVTALTSFQALAEGDARTVIANSRNISKHTVAKHVEVVRGRMRASWNAAAVYRLHGVVPAVLKATFPPCPVCAAAGAS
ncbi:hypothetical protein ACIQOV_03975 [Kitasatospora sp. NPDC091257]|uniref:hypothetical protein n=1 Tax=Kitasatospora sp. NPDC091257 TaxID=3364084 RepID=UPI0037FF45CA